MDKPRIISVTIKKNSDSPSSHPATQDAPSLAGQDAFVQPVVSSLPSPQLPQIPPAQTSEKPRVLSQQNPVTNKILLPSSPPSPSPTLPLFRGEFRRTRTIWRKKFGRKTAARTPFPSSFRVFLVRSLEKNKTLENNRKILAMGLFMAVVYITQAALEKAQTHFSAEAKKGLEAMGLLLGEANSFNGRKYSFITDYITSKTRPSVTSVFRKTLFNWRAVKRSHQSWLAGAFYRTTGASILYDSSTQKIFFEDYNIALVIDRAGKSFQAAPNGYQEVGYAIVPVLGLWRQGFW